ncbi:MAG: hypothetical protein Tsb0034_02840 [Ekhidna sp.]
MKKSLVYGFVMIVVISVSHAQNTRDVATPKPPRPQYQASKKEKKGLFSFLKKDKAGNYTTEEEERMALRKRLSATFKERAKTEYKANRRRKKEAKKGEKFHGHKRPPKKRPAGKQKFCKICKIKH